MHVDSQRHGKFHDIFHCVAQNFLHAGKLGTLRLKHKFVVDLNDDSAVEPAQIFFSTNHRQLDDVRRAALNRRVHRHTLSQGTQIEIFAVNRGQIASPPEHRRDVAAQPCLRNRRVKKFFHAGITLEVQRNIFAGLFAADVQVARKPVVADSVDDAEVDGLSFAAQVGSYRVDSHAENFSRRPRMNILPASERVD